MKVIVERNVRVRTRDGIELATDIYRPDVTERVPVILKRTPYDRTAMRIGDPTDPIVLAEAGYAVLSQDVRGRFGSGGTFVPFVHESSDGADAIAWAGAQAWSTGRVGMLGASYVGATQWLAAQARPPALGAIVPFVTSSDYHEGWVNQGGAFQLGFSLYWVLWSLAYSDLVARSPGGANPAEEAATVAGIDTLRQLYRRRPVSNQPLLERWAPYYRDWLKRPLRDASWKAISPQDHHDRTAVPALNIGGWYDVFIDGTLRNFMGMRARGATEQSRTGQRLLIGPWSHVVHDGQFPERRYGMRGVFDALDPTALHRRWFDRWLKGLDNGVDRQSPVRIFVMGLNQWRDESDWPLPDTRYERWYLHSRGRANTAGGDGRLAPEPPGAGEPSEDSYRYDPRDPVPTLGGATLQQRGNIGLSAGPYDQHVAEARHDVLCYTSEPLREPLEVTGPLRLVLFVGSSALDTDFTGKLVDVWPDGRAEILCDGILRARYRNGLETTSMLDPGRVYELMIEVGATSMVFPPGHRVRLDVSSSNFPRFDANTNTGKVIADDGPDDFVVAVNRVFHDPDRPSHLVLPVIDRR